MKLNEIILGDCLEKMKELPHNSVDAVVTDPPYGLSFMGSKWDYDVPSVEIWKEVLRVLKPGGHLLAACGTRTQHRMAVNIEDAGFEIRDLICWAYGSGFPKSLNVGKKIDEIQGNEREVLGIDTNKIHLANLGHAGYKDSWERTKGNTEWEAWGTSLKPAVEIFTLARKPISEANIAMNCLKWGTGALNIDACRVGEREKERYTSAKNGVINCYNEYAYEKSKEHLPSGRFPANIIHDGSDEVAECFPETNGSKRIENGANRQSYINKEVINPSGWKEVNRIRKAEGYNDNGGNASRFFYCAKASRAERDEGLENKYFIYNLEIITEYGSFTVENLFFEKWENGAQNQIADLNGEALQQKDTLEVMTAIIKDKDLSTLLFGKNITELFPTAIKFTTLTGLNQIIELKTLNYYLPLSTKECTEDVIKTIKESGLNLVENVGLIKLLSMIFTKGKTGFPLGVKIAAKKTQQLTNIKEKLKIVNNHITVKPIALMRYLCRLITPKNGLILEPFAGSGTTCIAAIVEGFNFVAFERDTQYYELAKARVDYYKDRLGLLDEEEETENKPLKNQLKLF